MISQENAVAVLEGLRIIQYTVCPYAEFIKILKKRISRYTGKTEVMFYNERKLVIEMGRLGVLQELNGLNKSAK